MSTLTKSFTADDWDRINRCKDVDSLIDTYERITNKTLDFDVEVLVRKSWSNGWSKGLEDCKEMMK